MKVQHSFYLAAPCLAVLGTALAFPAPAAARVFVEFAPGDAVSTAPNEDQLYSEATRAINESPWSDAASLLDQVIEQHGRRADGACYWKAYVDNKQGLR